MARMSHGNITYVLVFEITADSRQAIIQTIQCSYKGEAVKALDFHSFFSFMGTGTMFDADMFYKKKISDTVTAEDIFCNKKSFLH